MPRSNYFNTLSLGQKLDQLGRCRFMQRSEFAGGIAAIAGKKVVVVGCGAQGLNQGLNMRDSGCDVSYTLRQVACTPYWQLTQAYFVGTLSDASSFDLTNGAATTIELTDETTAAATLSTTCCTSNTGPVLYTTGPAGTQIVASAIFNGRESATFTTSVSDQTANVVSVTLTMPTLGSGAEVSFVRERGTSEPSTVRVVFDDGTEFEDATALNGLVVAPAEFAYVTTEEILEIGRASCRERV